MERTWDRRVVSEALLDYVRSVQAAVRDEERRDVCRLSGGAALSGVHLRHRLSNDLDLFCDSHRSVRETLAAATGIAAEVGGSFQIVRDGGTFIRGMLTIYGTSLDLDIAHEPSVPLAERDEVEGIIVDSLDDMRANKITCLLSRSEPRDLVDLYFLDRFDYPPEADLAAALSKDAGVDPGILSHLLRMFPTSPLPRMLLEFEEATLKAFRDDLSRRFRAEAIPRDSGES